MEKKIIILTLTFNRPDNIKELFFTLQEQTDKDFVWFIVNDGSSKDYTTVIEKIKRDADYEVIYRKKENGGKGDSTNYALDCFSPNDFVVIIDDDEFLYPNAVEKIRTKMNDYMNSDVGLINFCRHDTKGKVMATPDIQEDFRMSLQEHSKKKYFSDGYVGYYMKKVGNNRFPIYEGEKYIAPGVLMMLVSQHSSILWTPVVLGCTEYLTGGLTKSGRKLRLNNPRGMATNALLHLSGDCGFKNRIINSIKYYAYLEYTKVSDFDIQKYASTIFAPSMTKILGKIIAMYWRHKYNK